MNTLLKIPALALALLLPPATARALEVCEPEDVWVFASGDYYGTAQGASTAAANACATAWTNYASAFATGYTTILLGGGPGLYAQWSWQCQACPYEAPYLHASGSVHFTLPEAAGAATDLVEGHAVSAGLFATGKDTFVYLVDVLTPTRQVQVEVDATTGAARLVTPENPTTGQRP